MKNQMFALLGFVLILSSSSCLYFDDDDNGLFNCTSGSGPIETFEFIMAPFTGIEMSGAMDVYITQGPEQSVVVEGQENIVDLIDQDVDNGVWDIRFTECVRNYDQLKVYVTIPEIKYLELSGSGHIYGENLMVGDMIYLKIPGSGDIDLALNYEDIDGKISGSGDMDLEGVCENLDFSISGSGDLHAFGLEAQNVDLSISGSGDVQVFVTDILDVNISGSGDVFYRGYPVISADISGSGDLIDAN